MKALVILCIAFAAVAFSVASAKSHWELYKAEYGKKYNNPLEDSMRRAVFELNKERVENFNKHHAEKAGYKQGLSHMSDWTEDEFEFLRGNEISTENRPNRRVVYGGDISGSDVDPPIPEAVDWRTVENRVTRVKDQGKCNAGWAFAATGILEGRIVIENGSTTIVELSEQKLIDCGDEVRGCRDGDTSWALMELAKSGMPTETKYPYTGEEGKCRHKKREAIFTDHGSFICIDCGEKTLRNAVATYGPLGVHVDASLPSFRSYKSGIFYDKDCKNSRGSLTHGVLVVGYGSENGTDYWIVKNSWSSNWGEKGYMRLARTKDNHCGLETFVTIAAFLDYMRFPVL